MQNRLLIHIGYHKTATTWMQDKLFTPEHGYRPIANHEEVFRDIVSPHGLWFDPEPMQASIRKRSAHLPECNVPVISSEILSGHPFFGGRESDIYARRLHRIAPNARILISIRSQLRILPSVYMQYLLRGGTQPYDRFFRDENDLGFFSFSSLHFEYDRLVELYQELFGVENVYVMTQESLRHDLDNAVSGLAEFSGNGAFKGLAPAARTAHTPSYPEYAIPVLRRINHIQKSTLNPSPVISLGETPSGLYRGVGYILKRPPVSSLFARYRPVSAYVQTRFSGRFTQSNKRLAELTGGHIDLSAYY